MSAALKAIPGGSERRKPTQADRIEDAIRGLKDDVDRCISIYSPPKPLLPHDVELEQEVAVMLIEGNASPDDVEVDDFFVGELRFVVERIKAGNVDEETQRVLDAIAMKTPTLIGPSARRALDRLRAIARRRRFHRHVRMAEAMAFRGEAAEAIVEELRLAARELKGKQRG